jgi:uncharacterized protein YggE
MSHEWEGIYMADELSGEASGVNAEVHAPGAVVVRRTRPRAVVAGVAVAALLVGGAGLGLAIDEHGSSTTHAVSCSGTTPKLTVQGTGSASGTPNVLTLVLQVTTTAGSATAALSQNNTKVDGTVLALLAGGATKKDIQTSGLSVNPQYSYPKGIQTITGYQVANTVTATLHDVAKSGAAIDDVVNAAGNAAQINSLTFSFNNESAVQDEARSSAVHQAVSHAHAMAQAAGERLGAICSLTDNTNTSPPEPEIFGSVPTATSAGSLASPSVPIESGSSTETDQVTVVYALG